MSFKFIITSSDKSLQNGIHACTYDCATLAAATTPTPTKTKHCSLHSLKHIVFDITDHIHNHVKKEAFRFGVNVG